MKTIRAELRTLASWIKPGSRVLDLGCGNGELLSYLQENCQVTGYGVEIEQANIVASIQNNINVIQADIEQGLFGFEDNSFDYVIMTQTIQALRNTDKILEEMLRVGREGIITFPNFGHWRSRLNILFGHMPITKALPNTWYNTPNIHLCTLKDFEDLCAEKKYEILQRSVVDRKHQRHIFNDLIPNLLGEIALYRIQKSTKKV